MSLAIQVSNLEAERIAIASAADPGFDSEIRALFQGDSDELLKLKPFLAIISNGSTRTLVAYTLTWTLKQPRGSQITHVQSKYPDAVAAAPVRGNEIRPGEKKIDPMSIELNCGRWAGKAIWNSSSTGSGSLSTPHFVVAKTGRGRYAAFARPIRRPGTAQYS
jgi:hypothetical protein